MKRKDTKFPVILFVLLLCYSAVLQAEPRNVLLITIDTLRADHLSCNGSAKAKTPNIDALAKRGTNFTRVRTPVPLTLPAHASILTGLYPPSHGVRDNGTFRLADSAVSLAEIFKHHGYTTAAFVGSFVLDHRFGLSQGFETYDDNIITNAAQNENPDAERNADAVLKAYTAWDSIRKKGKPFFVWVHFYDPHAPYQAPSNFTKQYPNDPYSAEVAYTDSIVGKLLKMIPPDTLIALIGDHGEGLGDHQENTHSILIYNSTLHVPLILSAPGSVPAGKSISTLVRTIDLAPTLLELSSISDKIGEGLSLHPLLLGKQMAEVPAYSESLYPKLNLGWSELRGVEKGNFHYISAPTPELYDLTKDPGEKVNIFSQNRLVAQKLQALLPKGEKVSPNASMDPETAAKLRSLGYVSGGKPVSTNADPKTKMALWGQMQAAMAEFNRGNYPLAASQLEKIIAADPQLPIIYEYLSSTYFQQAKLDLSENVIKQAQSRGIQSAALMFNLGVIQYEKNNLAAADAAFRAATDLDPLQVASFYYRGLIHRVQKQPQPALQFFQHALEINPRYVLAWNGAGMCYSVLGDGNKAVDAFQRVIKLDPKGPQGYFNLAVQLEQMKRNKEAVIQYKKFLELTPPGQAEEQRQKALNAIRRINQL